MFADVLQRPVFVAALLLVLASCAVLPGTYVVTSAAGRPVQVFAATNRALDAARHPEPGTGFGPLVFGPLTISEPPGRGPGEVPMARGEPDPAIAFAFTDIGPLAGRGAFVRSLSQTLAARPPAQRSVMVYVHGFNVSFAEAAFRTAQISLDLAPGHVPAVFAWPGTPSPLQYANDVASVAAAGPDLTAFLDTLAAAGAEHFVIVAHSLGGQLVVNTLRALTTQGRQALLRRIDGVLLAAPDMDVDGFRSAAAGIDPLPQPFAIFASHNDMLLAISASHHGAVRLGSLTEPSRLAGLKVQLFDLSAYREGVVNHRVMFSSPELLAAYPRLRREGGPLGQVLDLLAGAPVVRSAN